MPNSTIKEKTVFTAPPNSVEAEQNILCCIMRDEGIQLDIIAKLKTDDFYQSNHQTIFDAMFEVSRHNMTVNFASVIDQLRRSGRLAIVGDIEYITRLYDTLPSTAYYGEYLKIVLRASLMRKLITTCSDIIEKAYTASEVDDVIMTAEEMIFELAKKGTDSGLVALAPVAAKSLVTITKRYESPEQFQGTKTGFYRLDRLTNGFHGGELIILAARPGVGKSALAMNMAEMMAKQGKHVAIFSLEMSNEQLVERLLSSMSGVPMSDIKSGRLSDAKEDIKKLDLAYATISNSMNLYGDDNPNNSVAQMRSECRRLKAQNKLDMVIIDYIGLMQDKEVRRDGRQFEVASISRGLKIMAKELNVPVMALSQLKRDAAIRNIKSKEDKTTPDIKPDLTDLRESGAIEQDADIVLFIHRNNSSDEGEVRDYTLVIAKHRNGELADIPLTWRGKIMRFEDERMTAQYEQAVRAEQMSGTSDITPEVPEGTIFSDEEEG
jgi:replicative DNA helicase